MQDSSNIFTVRVTAELKNKIQQLAEALDRPRSWIVHHALEDFVAAQAWQINETHKALADADAGDFATDDEVDALNRKYKKKKRRA